VPVLRLRFVASFLRPQTVGCEGGWLLAFDLVIAVLTSHGAGDGARCQQGTQIALPSEYVVGS
jgi:hypothetical protein